jgi:hypothetical protein
MAAFCGNSARDETEKQITTIASRDIHCMHIHARVCARAIA